MTTVDCLLGPRQLVRQKVNIHYERDHHSMKGYLLLNYKVGLKLSPNYTGVPCSIIVTVSTFYYIPLNSQSLIFFASTIDNFHVKLAFDRQFNTSLCENVLVCVQISENFTLALIEGRKLWEDIVLETAFLFSYSCVFRRL